MNWDDAFHALRNGQIVRRTSWQRDTFVTPMFPGSKTRGYSERIACYCVPGSGTKGWYPTDVDRFAADWEVVPFTAATRRYKPNFGEPRDFRLGYNPRLLKIAEVIARETGLNQSDACDLLIDFARQQNPRATLEDELFVGMPDGEVVADVLKYRRA